MAELDVQPKKPTPVWLWLLIVLIAVILLFALFKGCSGDKSPESGETRMADTNGQPIAVTAPDVSAVDFNAPKITDAAVTDPDVVISGNDHYTIYSLGENILFPTGETGVQNSADGKLKQVAASLNKRFKTGKIRVYGSTDNTGTAANNKALGKERAEAVKTWLVNNGGFSEEQISVHSFGETEPVASNATAPGREQNRYVAIVAFPGKAD